MNKVSLAVSFGILYVIIYAISIAVPSMEKFSLGLFAGSPFLLTFVIYCIVSERNEEKKRFSSDYQFRNKDGGAY